MPRNYWTTHQPEPPRRELPAPERHDLVPSSPEAFQQYAMLRLAQGHGLEAARELMARHEGGAESDNARIVRERRTAERGEELDALRGGGFVDRGAYDAPDLGPANIGVSYRPDGLGGAHTGHDLACLGGTNEVEGAPPIQPVTVPRAAKDIGFPGKKPIVPNKKKKETEEETILREAKAEELRGWLGEVNVANGRVLDARRDAPGSDLDDIDGIYLAGAPSAVHTQGAMNGSEVDAQLNVPKDGALAERDSRADYEHDLIARARNTGMPVMGICAGSWRLLEAYGGAVETLPEETRKDHYVPGPRTWDTRHAIESRPNTLVGGTFPVEERATIEDLSSGDVTRHLDRRTHIDAVNSTHWAVAATGRDGELRPNGGPVPARLDAHQRDGRLPVDPRDELEISAISPHGIPTVEAFESRHGAPVIGAQWHPEGYLPGAPGRENADPGAIEQSDALFRGFAQPARAYRGRRNMNEEFKSRYAPKG